MEAVAMYEKGMKTVSDSQVETIHQLRYIDINGQGRLFGGRLLEWIDETAALAAERHAGMNVTTASISHLDFKEGAYLNDTIVLVARVTYVGRTSIEVRCDTYLEDLETGMRHSINRAFLTEVCVDKEKLRPVDVIKIEANVDKLQRATGWKQLYSIDNTIEDVLEWWRKNIYE